VKLQNRCRTGSNVAYLLLFMAGCNAVDTGSGVQWIQSAGHERHPTRRICTALALWISGRFVGSNGVEM